MKLKNLINFGFLKLPHNQRLFRITLLSLVLLFFPCTTNAEPLKSSEVKAVFIYKFLKFIEWPEIEEKSTINICTVGNEEINESIDVINSMMHEQKKINVQKKTKKKNLANCKVIFLGEIEPGQTKKILKFSKENSILTISQKKGFLEKGGIINFLIINNRVNFEINNKSAKESGIKISSKLLRTAKRVIK